MSTTDHDDYVAGLHAIANFFDDNPDVPRLHNSLMTFCYDEASARAWQRLLTEQQVEVDHNRNRGFTVCIEGRILAVPITVYIDDRVAFVEPAPMPQPQVVEWLR